LQFNSKERLMHKSIIKLSPTVGGGFWVQLFGNDCIRYVQPIWLAV
jgi:hypothetical protein